jgi:2-polyprenyl-3-methyl-5-hydroxy-6-metoxy-1,4-benzoquinol methylase
VNGEDGRVSRTSAAAWDVRHAAHDPIESHDPDGTLIGEVGGLQPGRALDLATGDGRNAIWLAAQGWQVTAVDFSSVALERARASARVSGVDIDWVEADLLAWSPPASAFDLVSILFLHLPPDERRAIYARAAAAVRPGGTLLVVGHDRSNLVDGVGGPQDPTVLFTPAELVAELSGFSITRSEVIRRPTADGVGPRDAVVNAVRDPG